jgi:hypothetical protein
MDDSRLSGMRRRIRRTADMSQREFAAAVAGLRLALLDADGTEVAPMSDGAVRHMLSRRAGAPGHAVLRG